MTSLIDYLRSVRSSSLKPKTKLVLYTIISHQTGDDIRASIRSLSLYEIGGGCNMTKSTVRAHLAVLVEEGWLERDLHPCKPGNFRLLTPPKTERGQTAKDMGLEDVFERLNNQYRHYFPQQGRVHP